MARVSMSTIIVAHNSFAELQKSLPPLVAQLSRGDELIVVDNASSDGLATELGQLAPRARLIALGENVGFAAGVNRGVDVAGGELVVLLNPDVVVAPGWADAICAPFGGDWAAWMGLVLLDGGAQINTSGGVLHFTGFGWAGQVGEPASAAPGAATEVGFLSGACLAIPTRTWHEVEGFSAHFFMYCEDVDLSLKLRGRGGRLAMIPSARVEHAYEFSKGDLKWRLLERNRWATVLRTYPGTLLAAVIPALIAAEAAVWLIALRGGWAPMKARATADLTRALPRLIGERRRIQRHRVVSAAAFAESLTATLDSPYLGAMGRSPALRVMLNAYWRLVRALLGTVSA